MSMEKLGFRKRLEAAMGRANSLVCVGLDPEPSQFPGHLSRDGDGILDFNAAIIEATTDLVCAYKPNLGFYAAYGEAGFRALVATRRLIPPEIPVILDCKVGDIASTAAAYARGYFDEWGFNAITVSPYLGEDSLAPFLAYPDRGVLVLCKTSNPGGGDFQDLTNGSEPLYLTVAARAADWAARYPASVGLVVGATYPAQLAEVRARCPELPILLPGVGAQAGDIASAVDAGQDGAGKGLIVSASRSVMYASGGRDFAAAARNVTERLRDEVNAARNTVRLGAGSGPLYDRGAW
ncbi:MAG: orotidine-5'-phosphate decarboxylase [Chloroflexota bacterium]|nr:orotidine-5'-phosphate decarboxylase [Chloroflexota bacterium]